MEYMDNKGSDIKYSCRFGEVALNMGFLTIEQLHEASSEQIYTDPHGRVSLQKVIKNIVKKNWMTRNHIDLVLTEMFNHLSMKYSKKHPALRPGS